MQPAQKYTYPTINGKKVGKDWLKQDKSDVQTTEYRRHLYTALEKARDNYVGRLKAQGQEPPASVMGPVLSNPQETDYLTEDPKVPNFTQKRSPLHKHGTGCLGGEYTRYFTVDNKSFSYYENAQSANIKKTLTIQGAKAEFQEFEKFKADAKVKGNEHFNDTDYVWTNVNNKYRVGIHLKERLKGARTSPIFFYTDNLHEGKILTNNVNFQGDQFALTQGTELIDLGFQIEKATRLNKIMKLLVYAKDKRTVQFYNLNRAASDMATVAVQAQEFGRILALKWINNMLDGGATYVLQSAFRAKDPANKNRALGWSSLTMNINEVVLQQYIKKLARFIQQRKEQRPSEISKEIQKQKEQQEDGILVDYLEFTKLIQQGNRVNYEKVMGVQEGGTGSLILDPAYSYENMIVENRTIRRDKINPGDFMRLVKLNQVSFISTDLDQYTQFDFNNKSNNKDSYTVRIYGPIKHVGAASIEPNQQCIPAQLGLDYIRKEQADYKLSVSKINFPAKLLQMYGDKKLTVFVKIVQWIDGQARKHVYNTVSHQFRMTNNSNGTIIPSMEHREEVESGIFHLSKIADSPKERFTIGLVVRLVADPIPQAAEQYLTHEELYSHHNEPNPQIFDLSDQYCGKELKAEMKGFKNQKFSVEFSLQKARQDSPSPHRKQGPRLLVGKYVLYKAKVCYVKALYGNAKVDLVEMQSKKEHQIEVSHPELQLIENWGVNVFKLTDEPNFINKLCSYDWILEMKVKDKRALNQIHQKIQFQQAAQAYAAQDTKVRDPTNTIRGELIISPVEVNKLVLADEKDRNQGNNNKQIKPYVIISLRNEDDSIAQSFSTQKASSRNFFFGIDGESTTEDLQRQNFSFGEVNHSGLQNEQEVMVRQERKMTILRRPQIKSFIGDNKQQIVLTIMDGATDQEVGEARVRLDDLIDVHLEDLAQEHSSGINRFHIIKKKVDDFIKKGGDEAQAKEEFKDFTQYAGTIRIQTLFKPSKDTCVRFEKTIMQPKVMNSPHQLLHLEHLLQKTEFDNRKFAIPQKIYNPNDRNFGREEVNLESILQQSAKDPVLGPLLSTLKDINKSIQSNNQQISQELWKQIDSTIRFQTPFEKTYILLKLSRNERPFIEPVFQRFINSQLVYSNSVKTEGLDSLSMGEWQTFIDEIQDSVNSEKFAAIIDRAILPTEERKEQEEVIDDGASVSALSEKSFKSSLVLKLHQSARAITDERNQAAFLGKEQRFSLVTSKRWEAEPNGKFAELFSLIKAGIPKILRTAVWSDLMKSSIQEASETKNAKKYYGAVYKDKDDQQQPKSVFQNFVDISDKYDCVAFRQVDQDIADFKFPAYFYDESTIQNKVEDELNYLETNQDFKGDKASIRKAKMKLYKYRMRKLLRALILWGKTFKVKTGDKNQGTEKEISYQFVYPTSFLKFLHRMIDIMTVEQTFWIIVGLVGHYPRLWCLEQSSLIGDSKHNFRFECTVLKSAVELHYPEVSKKLKSFGLPLDLLVYDSVTSLYSDQFHSDTLYRIWDLMIFYLNTNSGTTKRRGIQLLLAPALFIISQKEKEILDAVTIKDVIDAYSNGCSISYDPSEVIKQVEATLSTVFADGGSGNQGLFSSLFGSSGPSGLDIVRQNKQMTLDNLLIPTKKQNQVIHDFVENPKNADDPSGLAFDNSQETPKPKQLLSYEKWRKKIYTNVKAKLKSEEGVEDDDIYVIEDVDIYKKSKLDIKGVYIYLHNLENFYGTGEDGDDAERFKIQIQYGNLNTKQGQYKFEVRSSTKNDESPIYEDADQNLQFYYNFKYYEGFNHIKIKIMTTDNKRVSHCYIDLHGLQRSKFIYIQKVMNAVEYIQEAGAKFNLTQVKASVFLQQVPSQLNESQQTSDERMKLLQSMKKLPPNNLSTSFQQEAEQSFQKSLGESLNTAVNQVFSDSTKNKGIEKEGIPETISSRFKFVNILPKESYGSLEVQLFKRLMQDALPEFSFDKIETLYNDYITGNSGVDIPVFEQVSNLEYQNATLDIESQAQGGQATDSKYFSLRNFLFSLLFNSPLTVKEKLDIIYDLIDISNKYSDGLDLQDAIMINHQVLNAHMYNIPYNEVVTSTEYIVNDGKVGGIISAFWTRRRPGDIKLDMDKSTNNGVVTYESLMSYTGPQISGEKLTTVDITDPILQTFQLYQNMFGNKTLDFNKDTTPFSDINNLFLSMGQGQGTELLNKVAKSAQEPQRFRLCLISEIRGGERILTEFNYDIQSGELIQDELENADDENSFKKAFKRNINVIDLSGSNTSLTKGQFFESTKKMPFVYDMLRAETLWQDREVEFIIKNREVEKLKKTKYIPNLIVFVPVDDKVVIFRFGFEGIMQGKGSTCRQIVSGQMWQIDLYGLSNQDIIYEMRPRIADAIKDHIAKGNLNVDHFKSLEENIYGGLEFFVRKVPKSKVALEWLKVHDFDRLITFSDDEVIKNEVVFKLVKTTKKIELTTGGTEVLDERPQYIIEGYDCLSIYKHSDDSYEWRPCRILSKQSRFGQDAGLDNLNDKFFNDQMSAKQSTYSGPSRFSARTQREPVEDSDRYIYKLEFEHLKSYGREMHVRRRREDIIFSKEFQMSANSFEADVTQFILDRYKE